MRIVVCGHMVRHPVAGNILAFLSYLAGLDRLGHQVVYVEESGWPNSCFNPRASTIGDDPTTGMRIAGELATAYGLDPTLLYVNTVTGQVHGGKWEDVKSALASADLLLNLGGVCWLPEFRLCPRRALVDMDPMFTQAGRFGLGATADHHVHFSYGCNIGQPGCTVPTLGITWIPTVPPVVTDLWPVRSSETGTTFTTIANWAGYSGITFQGEHYGQKDEEFLRIGDLPGRTRENLEIAGAGIPDNVAHALTEKGWRLRNSGEVSHDFSIYRSYISTSRGEFTVAKHAYVKTRSGWFSDRSVCYLACGLPVIMQDTGFSEWLKVGQGVLGFSSIEEAATCLGNVGAGYEGHRQAARQIADKVFAVEVVIPRILKKATAPVCVAGGIENI